MPSQLPNNNTVSTVNKFRNSDNQGLTHNITAKNPELKPPAVDPKKLAERQEDLLQMLQKANINPNTDLNWVKDSDVPASDFETYFQVSYATLLIVASTSLVCWTGSADRTCLYQDLHLADLFLSTGGYAAKPYRSKCSIL